MSNAVQRSRRSAGRAVAEHEFLEGIRRLSTRDGGERRGVLVGIGDDAAVVRGGARTVLTTDTMMEGVHFRLGWLTPRELGVRAWRAAVSDVAAMGARPQYVLLSLEVPVLSPGSTRFDPVFAAAVIRGVASDASRAGATLVGGNISAAACWGVTVTVVGEARRKAITRDGARAGDAVFVTGALGGSAAGVAALERSGARAAAAHTTGYRKPPYRVEIGAALAEAGLLHAMIDVSDGLLQDLGHICRRSGVAIRVDSDTVPVHAAARAVAPTEDAARRFALTGGEDYELAFTASPSRAEAIAASARAHRCRVTKIGVVEKGRAGVTDVRGRDDAAGGFDHFPTSRRAKR